MSDPNGISLIWLFTVSNMTFEGKDESMRIIGFGYSLNSPLPDSESPASI